jgi:hypothetical protein
MIWIVLLLFIVFQPGLFLTIPPVGKNWWMSGKTSLTAVVIHGILFALAVGYLLPGSEGFSPMIGGVTNPRLMTGGVKPGDPTSEAATEAAMQVLAEFDRQSNPTYVSGLVKVTTYSEQIVSGTITNITLQWAPSKCVKSADKAFFEEYSPGECPPAGRAIGVISARIYSQPWTDTNDVRILESKLLKVPLKPAPKPKSKPAPKPKSKPKKEYD